LLVNLFLAFGAGKIQAYRGISQAAVVGYASYPLYF